ncbi:MAG TPA: hypothetical protein VG710_13305 [Opitutus sp.]|nr:hypothetical protein [Opitutus sp.]
MNALVAEARRRACAQPTFFAFDRSALHRCDSPLRLGSGTDFPVHDLAGWKARDASIREVPDGNKVLGPHTKGNVNALRARHFDRAILAALKSADEELDQRTVEILLGQP